MSENRNNREQAEIKNTEGEGYCRIGNIDGAIAAFNEAISLFPPYAIAKNNLAVAYWQLGDTNKALKYALEARREAPDNQDIILNLKAIHYSITDIDDAYRSYFEYLENTSDQEVIHFLLDLKRKHIQTLHLSEKYAVFVSDRPRSRETKIAFGLRQLGWDVVLLHRYRINLNAARFFSHIEQYQNPQDAIRLAAKYNPAVYHVFSSWDYSTAAAFVSSHPGLIVFDDYDVMAGMIREDFLARDYPQNMALERFCLENADGLTCRHLELQFAKRHLGYRYRGKRMILLDCCWDNLNLSPVNAKTDHDELHIVYCGNLDPWPAGTTQADEISYHRIITSLARGDVHFHIYPAFETWMGDHEKEFGGYYELAGKLPLFHLHQPVFADNLIGELSQYDAGWFDYHLFLPSMRETYQERLYREFGTGNKWFDYLDAGLPSICRWSRHMELLAKRAGVYIPITDDLFHDPRKYLNQFDWVQLKENARQTRAYYSARKAAVRLITFYESL